MVYVTLDGVFSRGGLVAILDTSSVFSGAAVFWDVSLGAGFSGAVVFDVSFSDDFVTGLSTAGDFEFFSVVDLGAVFSDVWLDFGATVFEIDFSGAPTLLMVFVLLFKVELLSFVILSLTELFALSVPFLSGFLSTIVTDFSFALSSIVLTLFKVDFSGILSLVTLSSDLIDLSIVFRAGFVNLDFSSVGLFALSACFAVEGLTSFSSTASDEPFSDFSLIVTCFLSTAEKRTWIN